MQQILISLSESELKAFLREAIKEVLLEVQRCGQRGAPDILGVSEAAEFLKLKISTLYEKTSEKTIPYFKKGNKVYFFREELEQWIKEGKVKTKEELHQDATTASMRKTLDKKTKFG